MLGVFALTEIFYTTHIQDGIKLIHVPTRTTESEMGAFVAIWASSKTLLASVNSHKTSKSLCLVPLFSFLSDLYGLFI